MDKTIDEKNKARGRSEAESLKSSTVADSVIRRHLIQDAGLTRLTPVVSGIEKPYLQRPGNTSARAVIRSETTPFPEVDRGSSNRGFPPPPTPIANRR